MANETKRFNPILERQRIGTGHAPRPENPEIYDLVHGLTSRQIEQKVNAHEDLIVKKRQQCGKHAVYDPIVTPKLGQRTKSMKQNILLAKPSLGCSMTSGTKQMKDMTHGVRTIKLTAAEDCMYTWPVHNQLAQKQRRSKQQLDYVEMNRRALTHGLVTPKEQLSMRKSDLVYQKPRPAYKIKRPDMSHLQTITHGMPSGHSTSVSELITTKFGDQWLKETKEAENQERERARLAKLKGYAMTRAAILRTKHPEPPATEPWKMKRFQHAKPCLSTFRSPTDRQKATARHDALTSDCEGTAHHGIPQHITGH